MLSAKWSAWIMLAWSHLDLLVDDYLLMMIYTTTMYII